MGALKSVALLQWQMTSTIMFSKAKLIIKLIIYSYNKHLLEQLAPTANLTVNLVTTKLYEVSVSPFKGDLQNKLDIIIF